MRTPTCESDHGTAQLLETRAGSFPGTLPTFQLQQLDNQKGCWKAKVKNRNNKKKSIEINSWVKEMCAVFLWKPVALNFSDGLRIYGNCCRYSPDSCVFQSLMQNCEICVYFRWYIWKLNHVRVFHSSALMFCVWQVTSKFFDKWHLLYQPNHAYKPPAD